LNAEKIKSLWLKKNEDRRLHAGHSWVFSNEVDTHRRGLEHYEAGDTVIVRSDRDKFIGYAMINPHSLICARLLSHQEDHPPSAQWLHDRVWQAHRLRQSLGFEAHYRMIFGESDHLPGVIADRYGDVVILQLATAWMENHRAELVSALRSIDGIKTVVLKNDSRARSAEGLEAYVEVVEGTMPEFLTVLEDDRVFEIELKHAQKTGWFYDQRFNRQQFLPLIKSTGEALDVCCYAGGWAVALARRGFNVSAVDSSGHALAQAKANGERNGVSIAAMEGDAFEVLQGLVSQGRRFDAIVVDPPAFIQRRKDEHAGFAAYRKLNQLAVQLLTPQGFIISCSCSFHLPAELFPPILARAAQFSARSLQIIASGGQSPDHPVHPAIPETRYLKALLAAGSPEV